MNYEYAIIDCNNLGYRVENVESKQVRLLIRKQVIYKNLAIALISKIKEIEEAFNVKEVILLFDNYDTKYNIHNEYKRTKQLVSKNKVHEKYKSHRTKREEEFYHTFDFIKYYYLINESKYHTIQIPKLEADDFVGPVLRNIVKDKTALLVTNDIDWAIYISDTVHMAHSFDSAPMTTETFKMKYGYYPSYDKILLYKILFGDKSDNIDVTYEEVPLTVRKELFSVYDSYQELLNFKHIKTESLKPYIPYIQSRERELKINLYLLEPAQVSDMLILSHYTTGRNSSVGRSALDAVLFNKIATNTINNWGEISIIKLLTFRS
jgi:5'-3' exonuclease